jgi:tripartite-type tricarboxylate transporter receptor subunit TctC
MNRRTVLTFAAIALAAGATVARSPAAQAQKFPSEPITLVVAWPAGGGSDISMRLLADAVSKQIGVPVVVLNKPGAGGAIGHREIVNAKPDGYTIGMFSSGASRCLISTPKPIPSTSCSRSRSSAKIRTRCR